MNNSQAQFVLRSYRPGGEDARDPVFQDALDQAAHDPSLKAWFGAERKRDDLLQAKLREVKPPDALLQDILATPLPTTSRSFWTRGRSALALAAAVAVMLGGTLVFTPPTLPPLSFSSYASAATALLSHSAVQIHDAGDIHSALAWLTEQGHRGDVMVPPTLVTAAESGVTCKTYAWEGQSVALICFDIGNGQIAHYFVMDAKAFPEAVALAGASPRVDRQRGWNTATWSDGTLAYVLAAPGDPETLHALL